MDLIYLEYLRIIIAPSINEKIDLDEYFLYLENNNLEIELPTKFCPNTNGKILFQ